MQVTYGTHTLDFTKLPAKSLEAMLKRGVTHFLGNEQASKVSGWKVRFVETEKREPNDDEVAEVKSAYITKALEALSAGTVGVATRGPAADPMDATMERIARGEISDVLKANGAKFVGKGEDRKVAFADGSSFTMDELIERRLANPEHGPRIRKDAEKAIKDAARKAEKAKVAGGLSAAMLG